MEHYDFRDSTHFMVGAIGQPGSRLFFLQIGDYSERLHLKLEKEQVIALAGFLESTLEDMPEPEFGHIASILDPFSDPEWIVGEISVGVDVANQHMIVSISEFPPEEEMAPSTAQIKINQTQANAFIADAHDLLTSSRPPCKLCGQPKNPDKHQCPRLN